MKTISVIIAAYRASAYINEAIRSVFNQHLPVGYELELILGIDGCEDTERAVANIQDDRLQVFSMDRNYGTYITFNTMMEFATGELIVRFDADDVMLKGYLQKQIELLEQQPETYLTWTKNNYMDEKGERIPEKVQKSKEELKYWEVRSPSNGQFMMRKSLWNLLGSFKSWPCNSDTDFLIRMRYMGCAEYGIDEVLYLRRIHPDSLTQSESTGYNSDMRKKIVETMKRERDERSSKEECWVMPVVGTVLEKPVR